MIVSTVPGLSFVLFTGRALYGEAILKSVKEKKIRDWEEFLPDHEARTSTKSSKRVMNAFVILFIVTPPIALYIILA